MSGMLWTAGAAVLVVFLLVRQTRQAGDRHPNADLLVELFNRLESGSRRD